MAPVTVAEGWGSDALDLDAYLRRVGYTGDRGPTAAVLRALHRAHTTAIPFENLEIILGRPILLDVESLHRKLVRARRGGYCYEHVALFAAVLEKLGYAVTALQGRVSLGSDSLRPATHAVLLVTAADDDRVWLCDVGFGITAPEPIELRDGVEADLDGRRFRLRCLPGELDSQVWVLYEYEDGRWIDQHCSTLTPQYPVDLRVGNHYVSTHRSSPFTQRPRVLRAAGREERRLAGTALSVRRADGATETRQVAPGELPAVLETVFGIVLTPGDAAELVRRAADTEGWSAPG